MGGGKHLLLLPVLLLLVRCQNLQVSMIPPLKKIFVGDLFDMQCNTDSNEETVTWYLNNTIQPWKNKSIRIAAAAPSDSGQYRCESNGNKSEPYDISVLEYLPIASLTIETGQPVMRPSGSVVLKIENDDGLTGWKCRVLRGNKLSWIILRLKNDDVSYSFQPRRLVVPETVFWCVDKDEARRSNQVIIRTSNKNGALEMYPLPAVAGRSLTLRCLVWGADTVSGVIFYKDNTVLRPSGGSTYDINVVKTSEVGRYWCNASYTYHGQTVTPHQLVSDTQEVPVQVSPVGAVLSEKMSCSCPSCGSSTMYRFYMKNGESWTTLGPGQTPISSGTYQCRAVLDYMKTLPSRSLYYEPPSSIILILVGLVVTVIALVLLVAVFVWYKKKNTTGQIYEDVALKLQGDDKYDTLQPRVREAEYDTLNLRASGSQERGGEYEALNKKEMKDRVYDTLQATGAEGGDGGYEALKKNRTDGDGEEYQTLETKSALRKDDTDGGEYQTLDKLALKEGMDEGEYQTLETKGAAEKPEKDK